MISWFTIGIPAFFLALAPNTARAEDGFVKRVLGAAVPGGISAAAAAYTAYLVAGSIVGTSGKGHTAAASAAFLALVIVAFSVLLTVARPYQPWKLLLVGAMIASMLAVILTPAGREIFDVDLTDWRIALIAVAAGTAGVALRYALTRALQLIYRVWANRRFWRRPLPTR
ncbi:hypothetical protein [Microbacterium sp. CH-015]|uniref:hypothetical protein n=1 Tax=Microbacterium sp. CH-015 TaxID=3406734 RepID=UPI003C743B4F